METDFSDTPRTVTITAVKDEAAKRTIAENLSRITSGHPPVERVLARLDNLSLEVDPKCQRNEREKIGQHTGKVWGLPWKSVHRSRPTDRMLC